MAAQNLIGKSPGPCKKVELHVHLDGAVRPSTAWELALQKNIKIPGVKDFIDFQTKCPVSNPTNLYGFIQKFHMFWPPFSGDLDAIERMAYEFVEDEYYAGVVYAEPRWSPRLAMGDELIKEYGPCVMDECIRRVAAGLQRGEQDFGVMTRQILCSIYSKEFNDLHEVLGLCRSHYDKGVVGIDLLTIQPEHGRVDEAPFVEPIISVWQEAAKTCVYRTVHAGETGTPSSVERAIYQLGSNRVGHGYHVVQDDRLYQQCIHDQVHFEACPISSLMTGSVDVWGCDHPIARFSRDGVNFSINADDPTVTGHTVQKDYELLISWGADPDILAYSNINACNSSFLSDSEKKFLLKELETNKIGCSSHANED